MISAKVQSLSLRERVGVRGKGPYERNQHSVNQRPQFVIADENVVMTVHTFYFRGITKI